MKKMIGLFLVLTLLLVCMGGCVKEGDDSGESASLEKRVELKFTSLTGPSQKHMDQILTDKIKTFNSDNPYNVEIKYETYETEQYKTKLTTLMAANAQPDIFYTYEGGFLKPFVEGGKVYPVGDVLNTDQEWKNRFVDGVFGPLTFDGKIYAVPSAKVLCVVYYNKRLFAEAGIEKAPQTYDEFLSAIESLKKIDVIPITVPARSAWIPGQLLQQLANGVGGSDLYNGILDGSTTWDDPRFVKAAELLVDLVQREAFQSGFLSMTRDEGGFLFGNEEAAMNFMGTWDIGTFTSEDLPVSDNVDFFLLPPYIPENAGVHVGSINRSFGISAEAKNKEAAVDFLKSLSDKDVQVRFAYEDKQAISTKQDLDPTRLDPLTVKLVNLQSEVKVLTPWFDRIFGAGEGVEFNNAAVAIMADASMEKNIDPAVHLKELQEFAVNNATR